jgi:Uma2 family endonuclease
MATERILTFVPIDAYESDPELFNHYEYVDGALIGKPVPTWKHIELQGWIVALLLKYYSPQLSVGPELHSKVRETAWRLPDIAVQKKEIARSEKYGVSPLVLAIEIRSPEDKLHKLIEKFESYHDWGVPYCWMFDPERDKAWTYHKDEDFERVIGDKIAAGGIELSLAEIFSIFHT